MTTSPPGAGGASPASADRIEAIRTEYRHNVEVYRAFGIIGARWRAQRSTAAIIGVSLLDVLDAIDGMPDEP